MLKRKSRRAPRALRQGTDSRLQATVIAATAVALFFAGAASLHARNERDKQVLVRSLLAPAVEDRTHYSVVVVAQKHDCQGNLGHLAFIERRSIQRNIGTRQLLIEGNAEDTVFLRPRLPVAFRNASMRLLSAPQRQLLNDLGHDATPLLALFDPAGRLVLLSAMSDDVVARTAMVRAVTRIVESDPSR